METLEIKVLGELKNLQDKFSKDDQVIEFEKTNIEFDKLVKEGYVKKRGNNLLSPAEAHIKNKVWFNVK